MVCLSANDGDSGDLMIDAHFQYSLNIDGWVHDMVIIKSDISVILFVYATFPRHAIVIGLIVYFPITISGEVPVTLQLSRNDQLGASMAHPRLASLSDAR